MTASQFRTTIAATATATTTDRSRVRLGSALLASLLGLAACGGGDLLLPGDGEPAIISIVSGDNQTGIVGQPLEAPLVVQVTDPGHRPVRDVEVVFVPPEGAQLEPNDTVLTNAEGMAAVHYTLSTTAGEQMVEARAIPIVPSSSSTTTFRASAQAEPPVALIAARGDGQTGQIATALAESLAVRVVDRFGNGVGGIEVTWNANDGGEVSPTSATTGADGRAATQRTLGSRPGAYQTTASAPDLEGSPVSFTSTGVAPPSPQLVLVTQPSSSAAAGVPLEQQPVIQLQDPTGAPLGRADVSVTVQIASGEGSVGGRTTATSDANGQVVFTNLELRGETGSRTLIFAADGFTPVTSGSVTVGPGPPSPAESSVAVPNGTAGSRTRITLRLEDEFENRISGASNRISIAVEGPNAVSDLTVTDEGDGSYSASYVPIHSGTDRVHVTFGGAPLAGSPFQSRVEPGPADPGQTTAQVTRTSGFITRITAVVTVRDAQGNLLGRGGDDVQVQVNNNDPISAIDNGDGVYFFSVLTLGSQFQVGITLNGVAIAGSPFTPAVQ